MDTFHPFLGNDQVQACIMSFMILFYSKSYATSETNGSTKMKDIIYGIKNIQSTGLRIAFHDFVSFKEFIQQVKLMDPPK